MTETNETADALRLLLDGSIDQQEYDRLIAPSASPVPAPTPTYDFDAALADCRFTSMAPGFVPRDFYGGERPAARCDLRWPTVPEAAAQYRLTSLARLADLQAAVAAEGSYRLGTIADALVYVRNGWNTWDSVLVLGTTVANDRGRTDCVYLSGALGGYRIGPHYIDQHYELTSSFLKDYRILLAVRS